VHEAAVSNHHADVGGAAAHGLEEDEIPRLHVLQVDLSPFPELILYLSRDRPAVTGERPLHEAAAIESGRIAPTIPVWDSEQIERRLDDCGEGNGIR